MNTSYNYPFPPKEKLKALNLWKTCSADFVARRYHCTVRSLYRWRKLYDGTLESLENRSHRPQTPHPNSHTVDEIKHIKDLLRRNPHIGLNELYGKLRRQYSYTRHPISLYRFLRKNKFFVERSEKKKYIPKPYDTPIHIGEKMQMDVKYVPTACYTGKEPDNNKYYQYTMIDEATRQRFIYPYMDKSEMSTLDFVKRAISYFGYKPRMIQTDNGIEFTNSKEYKKVHLLDQFCTRHRIVHRLIKPRTPRHNGKVERSHRTDTERFYKHLRFYSYDDLIQQMSSYLKRSNDTPTSVLKSVDRSQSWLTPNEKRKELLLLDWGVIA